MATDSDKLADDLLRASWDGNEDNVLQLLKEGADPNSSYYRRVHRGLTPLHMASHYNHPVIVRHLLLWGSTRDPLYVIGWSPLHYGCDNNSTECVEELLAHHCRTDIKDKGGMTAEDLAREEGYTALADRVASYKAPPRDPLSSFPSVKQMSSLQVAKWQDLGRQLGVPDAELEGLKNDQQPTAATLLAAKIKNPEMRWKEIVDGLLRVGDYKLATTVCAEQAVDGHSPLSVAALHGWLELLKFLVETEGQDPKEPINKTGDTVISLACAKGHIGLIDYLLRTKGFDLNGKVNAAGDTLLTLATSLKLPDVVSYLEKFKTGPSADRIELRERYVARLNELIAKRLKATNLQYLKLYFIGSSGLGKTTTRKRLTGAIVNLSKLTPEQRKRCSTYLAECTQVLAVVDESAGSKLLLKASENEDEAAQLMFNYLYRSTASEAMDGRKSPTSTTTSNGDSSSPAADQLQASPQDGVSTDPKTTQHQDLAQQEIPTTTESQQVNQDQAPTHIKVDVDQVITRLRSIVGSGTYAEELLGKILLNLVDVGGQPGFLEMLPFLSKGPGVFLSFFPLDKDLDEPCKVSYERDGEKITPYDATYTNREAISQVLSSISHHVSFDSTTDKELADKLESFSDVEPVVTLVGTFKDSLETQVKAEVLHEKLAEEFPKATKGDMEEAVRRTLGDNQVPKQQSEDTVGLQRAVEHHLSSEPFKQEAKDRLEQALDEKNEALSSIADNFAELLSLPTGERCFIPVDNYTGIDPDLDPLRKHLQDIFASHFKDAKVPIQPSQLLLGIVLRKEYDIVSMEDCIQIGRALNMGEEDVRFTVWLLDFLVGALIYHPEIDDDWFKENIICSPQVIFDSISTLIVKSLVEIDSQKGRAKCKPADRKDWVEKGQFSLEMVKRCHSEKCEKKVQEGKLIPVDKLILLLEHSSLLAKITVKEKKGMKSMCFIPAILECATPEELRKSPSPDADTPFPAKITFKPRYVPVGVFCAMISRLASRGRDGVLGMKWELADSCVKRNLVTFRVEKHLVTLVAHVESIEVRIIRQKRRIPLHDLSAYVLSTVIYIMKEISSHLSPIIAFDCPCGQHQSKYADKLCLLSEGISPCFECEQGEVSLTPHQQYWFAKEMEKNASVKMEALQYAKSTDLKSLSFEWSMDGSKVGTGNELKLDDVTEEDCEGYYTCEIFKDGEPFFNVYRSLKIAGDANLSANDELLSEVREALSEIRADWYSLAVELDVNHGTRKDIAYQPQTAEVCFNVMLQHWVGKTAPPPTRASLVRALKSPTIGRGDIVNDKFKDVADADCAAVKCQGSLSDTLKVDEHLKMVRVATWELRAKWKKLAVELEITGGVKEEIEYNHPNQAGRCYTALLEHWLTKSSPAPTWAALIEALRSGPVGHGGIADTIESDLTKKQ